MTTESRMREALEETAWAIQELLALINGECPGILDSDRGGSWAQVERIDKALASAMTALSPPARRTSYEWRNRVGASCFLLRFGSSYVAQYGSGFVVDHCDMADEMARLANLAPPEEKA